MVSLQLGMAIADERRAPAQKGRHRSLPLPPGSSRYVDLSTHPNGAVAPEAPGEQATRPPITRRRPLVDAQIGFEHRVGATVLEPLAEAGDAHPLHVLFDLALADGKQGLH